MSVPGNAGSMDWKARLTADMYRAPPQHVVRTGGIDRAPCTMVKCTVTGDWNVHSVDPLPVSASPAAPGDT